MIAALIATVSAIALFLGVAAAASWIAHLHGHSVPQHRLRIALWWPRNDQGDYIGKPYWRAACECGWTHQLRDPEEGETYWRAHLGALKLGIK